MISDVVYAAVLGIVQVFLGLWALVLGLGFVLSLREDVGDARKSSIADSHSSKGAFE
jgi:hypothetical protein